MYILTINTRMYETIAYFLKQKSTFTHITDSFSYYHECKAVYDIKLRSVQKIDKFNINRKLFTVVYFDITISIYCMKVQGNYQNLITPPGACVSHLPVASPDNERGLDMGLANPFPQKTNLLNNANQKIKISQNGNQLKLITKIIKYTYINISKR